MAPDTRSRSLPHVPVRLTLLGMAVLAILATPATSAAWLTQLATDFGFTQRAVADEAGDIYVAGRAGSPGSGTASSRLVVWKVRGTDGAVLWEVTPLPPSTGRAAWGAVALEDDRVVLAAFADHEIVVLRLAAADGADVGRWTAPVPVERGTLRVASDGAVVVCNETDNPGVYREFPPIEVVKYDAGGGRQWRYAATGSTSTSISLDAHGDVVLPAREVTKLAGSTGVPLWMRSFAAERPERALVTAAGDIAVETQTLAPREGYLRLALLSGVDGAVLWQRAPGQATLLGTGVSNDVILARRRTFALLRPRGRRGWQRHVGRHAFPASVSSDGRGTLVAVIGLCAGDCQYGPYDMQIARLDERTGAVRWKKRLARVTKYGSTFWADTIFVDRRGHIVIAGATPTSEGGIPVPLLAKLSGKDGRTFVAP